MENSIRYTGEHISVEDFSTELVKRIKDLYNAAEQSIDISYGVAMKNNKPLNAVGVGFMDSNTGPVIYVDDMYKTFINLDERISQALSSKYNKSVPYNIHLFSFSTI